MKSNSQEVRERQLNELQKQLEERTAMLKNDGCKDIEISHDSSIRHIKGAIKQARTRIKAIGEKERVLEESKKAKEQHAVEKAQKSDKKKDEQPGEQVKEPKKKKVKKEKPQE